MRDNLAMVAAGLPLVWSKTVGGMGGVAKGAGAMLEFGGGARRGPWLLWGRQVMRATRRRGGGGKGKKTSPSAADARYIYADDWSHQSSHDP